MQSTAQPSPRKSSAEFWNTHKVTTQDHGKNPSERHKDMSGAHMKLGIVPSLISEMEKRDSWALDGVHILRDGE